jgi:hypothetical protein
MHSLPSNLDRERGQTLIETIVAIFLLTTALTTGIGLAIYAFNTSSTSQSEIIASNLAREGIDVVRMMRDTNWLEGDHKGGGWGLQPCADLGGKDCYPEWLTGPSGAPYHNYDIRESSNNNRWRLQFHSLSNFWESLETSNNYNLYLQSDGSYTHDAVGTSYFARRILIAYNTVAPYTASNPEVIVQSVVAWRGKDCTWAGTDPTVAPSRCKVVVEEHLTNWKDYQ